MMTDGVGDAEVEKVEQHLRGTHPDLLPAHVDLVQVLGQVRVGMGGTG